MDKSQTNTSKLCTAILLEAESPIDNLVEFLEAVFLCILMAILIKMRKS